MIIRRTLSIISSFCTTNSLKIPQLIQGDQLSSEGKYNLALDCYSRVVEIMNSARMNQTMGSDYLQAVSKLAATEFLLRKYNSTQKLIESLKLQNINDGYNKYFLFLYWSSHDLSQGHCKSLTKNSKNKQLEQEISLIVYKLMNVQVKINPKNQNLLPVLRKISENINNAVDYRKLLTSLIERSPKSQKTEKPTEQYFQTIKKNVNPELYLLYFMSLILQNKSRSSSDKQLINNKINEILKEYEKNRQKQVYKPLLNIIMSLIGQKQYMSAEGMIGHIKTSEMTLVNSYQSQDKNLINNIYRMLVTRAHNEPIELGWSKEVPISFGNLVIQRIIKAPLSGHSIDKLIC